MAHRELFFAFLEDACRLEDLKLVNLEGFDWSSRTESGMTLIRIHQALEDSATFKDAMKTIEWLIASGASSTQTCTGGAIPLLLAIEARPYQESLCNAKVAV